MRRAGARMAADGAAAFGGAAAPAQRTAILARGDITPHVVAQDTDFTFEFQNSILGVKMAQGYRFPVHRAAARMPAARRRRARRRRGARAVQCISNTRRVTPT